jgi:NADH-quinone oxidoreductase subunit L
LILIIGWAFVGFASYALISYWYRRHTATYAGMKAFVINVVGDVGLVLAAIILLRDTGHTDFDGVFESASQVYSQNEWTIVAVCLLILVGAFAKSAQIPLHTWLPDAMEGPTPVSALIHAATMVTAGVYLIARTYPLFELAPTAADISAAIGALTLVFAASVALVVTDLKRIIAYSTISQIGYMIVAVSIGAYGAGMFHLMTHAYFKDCATRCPSRCGRSCSPPSHWLRSRASPVTSPRTRFSRSPGSAEAATGSCTWQGRSRRS